MRKMQVTTYHLEMRNPDELRPARLEDDNIAIRRAAVACPELNRFLYTAVGGDWFWYDRLDWTYEKWKAYVDRPELETWVGYYADTPFGYFTLESQAEGNVELRNFGLLPQFIGRRLGGHLLTAAIERGWQMGASRVWVHTCTLDHPRALENYKARGFRLFKTEEAEQLVPDKPPGPWPGAR